MDQTLEERLRRLEDIEEIRALKSRYFYCCDRKDAKGMRACFKDGTVYIDYGAVGKFDNADALAKVFQDVGCHDYMVEMHHGMNPQIEMLDATRARGTWKLHYFLINTRFVPTSTLAMDLGEGVAKILFAGRVPPSA